MNHLNKPKIVLVTGLSGAGKTSAMAVLEDMGYHCIDRFPAALIDNLIDEIIAKKTPGYENVALSVTAKDFFKFYNRLKGIDAELTVLFLDASKEQLLLRYKYNRRNHPLVVAGLANSLEEGLDAEITEFSEIKSFASIIIDTTFLTAQNLTQRIQRFFSVEGKQTLNISFISFGYRKGLPRDADLVFDVRFLNNPYLEESLREKTGNDVAVYNYVLDDPKTQEYLEYLKPFLDYSFDKYVEESKHLLTVAIGCTGGQHRSVSIVNWLYDQYRKDYTSFKNHRDVKDEKTV